MIDDRVLDEVFFSKRKRDNGLSNLELHYCRHVNPDYCDMELSDIDSTEERMSMMTIDEYDAIADKLSNSKASKLNDRSADIIGYVTKSGKMVKYQKSTGFVVVYVDDNVKGHEIISLYQSN